MLHPLPCRQCRSAIDKGAPVTPDDAGYLCEECQRKINEAGPAPASPPSPPASSHRQPQFYFAALVGDVEIREPAATWNDVPAGVSRLAIVSDEGAIVAEFHAQPGRRFFAYSEALAERGKTGRLTAKTIGIVDGETVREACLRLEPAPAAQILRRSLGHVAGVLQILIDEVPETQVRTLLRALAGKMDPGASERRHIEDLVRLPAWSPPQWDLLSGLLGLSLAERALRETEQEPRLSHRSYPLAAFELDPRILRDSAT